MKRLIASLVVLAGIALLLYWVWALGAKSSQFVVGRALPPGRAEPQLISSWDTAILLAPDGSLWAWGGGDSQLSGQLSKQGVFDRPQRISPDSDWQKVSANWMHTVAIKRDGSLWGWGANFSGGTGQPQSVKQVPKPQQIGADKDWSDVKAGSSYYIALKKDGSLWGWGQNQYGQLGDSTISNKFAPTLINSDHDWKSIVAGDFNTYALKSNGTAWGWGLNFVSGGSGRSNVLTPVQIDAGTNWMRLSASDYVLLGVKSDGTLWIRGQNAHWAAGYYLKGPVTNFAQIGTNTDWQDAYAGQGGFFARKRDGSWWACGQNVDGDLALGLKWHSGTSRPLQRIPLDFDPWAFATGYRSTLILTRDGTLWTLGKRLGTEHSSTRQLKAQLDKVISKLPGHWPRFKTPSYITDTSPYRLWELPSEVRRNLGTNSVSK